MSLTSYRAAPPRGDVVIVREIWDVFVRFGDDLLSHVLRRSTIGAAALNGRVRDGTGCFACAIITKPKEHTVPRPGMRVGILGRGGVTSFPSQVFQPWMCFRSLRTGMPVFYWIKSSLSDN